MQPKSNFARQLNSIRKNEKVSKEIAERIAGLDEKTVKAIVPYVEDVDESYVKNLKNAAIETVVGKEFPGRGNAHIEAIIRRFGRPVFFIQNSLPQLLGDEIDKWKGGISNAVTKLSLKESIASVGRIEVRNYPGYDYLGTGWLVTDEYIVTNQHVAELIFLKRNESYFFRNFGSVPVSSNIDFLAEYNNENAAEFEIENCIYMAPQSELDMALLKVKWNTNSPSYKPLTLSEKAPKPGEDFVLIGYPASDPRTTLVDDMKRIFNDEYEIKRLAPGEIGEVWEKDFVSAHDATTLGGASGSALISLESGEVIGLHYAGKERVANYCVTAPYIKKVIDKLPKKSFFVTDAPTTPEGELISELVPRNCTLTPYTKIKVPSFKVTGRMICFASPDSTYAVTKRMFDSAKESLLIGIYDLSAEYMTELIIEAAERGVLVSLMLDIDNDTEKEVFNKLKRYGIESVAAPSCASDNISYFASSHEKVIVIDNKWTLIQSGNYSNRSIPFNEDDGVLSDRFKTGNRDMGIAIESRPLAKFFIQLLRSDMQLELSAVGNEAIPYPYQELDLLIEAPRKKPEQVFPSKQFNPIGSVDIEVVLSPDNYMDVIPEFLKSATKSIRIEQQYIRTKQPLIQKLLQSIPKNIEVQIILARPMSKGEKFKSEIREMQDLADTFGFEVRILSPDHFTHCHNKLIIIDDETVLISSQNWSDSAVSKNREAGVIIHNEEIAQYYSAIFNSDWTVSEAPLNEAAQPQFSSNLESLTGSTKYIRLNIADIQEV